MYSAAGSHGTSNTGRVIDGILIFGSYLDTLNATRLKVLLNVSLATT